MANFNDAKKEIMITFASTKYKSQKEPEQQSQTLHKEGQSFAVSRMFHNPPVKAQGNYQVKGWTENRNVCQDVLKTILEMVPDLAGAQRGVFIAQLGWE